jgi:hypothetical protein
MILYYPISEEINSEELVKNIINSGWDIQYIGPYHTVLLQEGSKVTYTIANNSKISPTLHFSYIHLQMLLSGRGFYDLYGD